MVTSLATMTKGLRKAAYGRVHFDSQFENAAPPGREGIPVRQLMVGWQTYKIAGHTASTVR